MIKTLGAHIKEFKKDTILTPICMVFEVVVETIIPLLMASIIDNGIQQGDMNHILLMGGIMVICAVLGLLSGLGGAVFGARASTGFARNLRRSMFENIQTFAFSNIDKYSTAGLVTRLTTDVTNVQNAFQMILRMCFRAPFSMIVAMIMAFYVNARLASIYLIAVIILGFLLVLIAKAAMKHFHELFKKYDELNASVQENVSAIRVVKAYVREDFENRKFTKASGKIYELSKKAENIIIFNMPLMQVIINRHHCGGRLAICASVLLDDSHNGRVQHTHVIGAAASLASADWSTGDCVTWDSRPG